MNDLKPSLPVKFSALHLDPNNPRIAPETRPGYESADALFADDVQAQLMKRMETNFEELVKKLDDSIMAQGWQPIDPILVWEHHKKKKHYVVVEGNTRLVTVRRIRARLTPEREKLARMEQSKGKYDEDDLKAQRDLVEKLERIVKDTDALDVYPIDAASAEDLEAILPRVMGVRHITHATQWGPYATNLYILSLYRKAFRERHGEQRSLAIEDDLVEHVAGLVALKKPNTRRSIQAASAFSRFQRRFEDRLSENDEFSGRDQYYFEQILQNKFAAGEFRFHPQALHLDDDMEEVLFLWAFQHPRGVLADDDEDGQSKNVLRKAEDIRLWGKIKRYDDKRGTAFAKGLDVENPQKARPMAETEVEFRSHEARISPISVLDALLKSFGELPTETLLTQASHLRPLLQQLKRKADEHLAMIDAVAKMNNGGSDAD